MPGSRDGRGGRTRPKKPRIIIGWSNNHFNDEYMSSAKMTPFSREAMLFIVEPRRFAASNCSKNVPRRVCIHLLKPC